MVVDLRQIDLLSICSKIFGMLAVTANRHAFIGRKTELAQLHRTARLAKASLIVCRGRRELVS